MSIQQQQPESAPPRYVLAIIAITLLAAALRLFNLGFGFFGDEFSLLETVSTGNVTEPNWPLLFWISKGVCQVIGVSEWKLRLAPALFGIAAIPAFYFAGRRIFGDLAMVLAGLLIAIGHWHLFHSQSARFYPAVFLLSGLAICWLLRGIDTGRNGFALAASAATVLSAGFHPTGIWPGIALGAYCALALIFPAIRGRLTWHVAVAYFAPLALVGLIFIGALFKTSTFISTGLKWQGYSPAHLVLGWVRQLGVPLLAVAGCWLLWLLRTDKPKGWYLFILGTIPLAGLLAVSLRGTSVRPDYVFAAAPIWYFLAGAATAAVAGAVSVPLAARAGLILALLVAELPSTVSHHLENLTCNPRLAYSYLKEHGRNGDGYFHNFVPMLNYYTGRNYGYGNAQRGQLKNDPATLKPILAEVEAGGKTAWFLIRTSRGGIGNDFLADWLARHAKVAAHWDAKRLDYEVSAITIYRFDPPQAK